MQGPQDGSLMPSNSFFNIDSDNVVLLTFKKADDGKGLILRLIETEGNQTDATLTLPILDIRHAYRTNLVEEDSQQLSSTAHSLNVTLQPFGIATVRVVTQ